MAFYYSVPVSTKVWICIHQHQTHIEIVQPNLINLKGPYLKRLLGRMHDLNPYAYPLTRIRYVRFLSFHMLGMHYDSYCT